jgi:hypothetical protein
MRTIHRLNRAWLALAFTAATLTQGTLNAKAAPPAQLAVLTANAGVTISFAPTSDPAVSKASATGVVSTSLLGNCVESAELEARFPTTPGQPVIANGTLTLTSSDGENSLKLAVTGTALPDPANPGFYNAKYQVTIIGGTGAYAWSKGLAEINEVIMFTSASTATATWTMKGFVVTLR